MNKMAVLVAAVVVAAAAALLSSHDDDSCRDVAVLEIGGGGDAAAGRRVELVPVDAAGPESLAFDGAGGGPYAGVSDGRVLRWVPGERRWEEHSSSCAPELLSLAGCTEENSEQLATATYGGSTRARIGPSTAIPIASVLTHGHGLTGRRRRIRGRPHR
ncbi:hypothetical protein SORBI_3005G029866 [Sorghum bicolor]|uniref:Uncharacterized protein n=1 Tax=Sorghum bicolor TaxID=4558 RepID=A0A1Z5RH40_SORBI|nr:hypothetical protein SORBI_3005G029866 [Sorghum bicolor]